MYPTWILPSVIIIIILASVFTKCWECWEKEKKKEGDRYQRMLDDKAIESYGPYSNVPLYPWEAGAWSYSSPRYSPWDQYYFGPGYGTGAYWGYSGNYSVPSLFRIGPVDDFS